MNNRRRTRYKAMLKTYIGNVYSTGDEKIDDKTVMILSYSASLSNRCVAPFYYNSCYKHYMLNLDIIIQEDRRKIEYHSMIDSFLCSCFKGVSVPSVDIGLIDTSNGPKIRI